MKAKKIGRSAIKGVNSLVNFIVLTTIVLMTGFAGYALWDSNQIYAAADKVHYEVYKPTAENEGKSFKELQEINPDVFAWLSVYGTNIDYPVTQGQNNMKYLNTNPEGLHSLSGSIFLDYNNSKNFSDFNSILYGHHMEKNTMFGEIGNFSEEKMFNSHKYGNLYFDGKDHGIEFFAFIHTSAYDNMIFSVNVKGNRQQAYLGALLAKAMYKRDVGVTTDDRIVLLSTCSSSSTNGRDILVGKITDEVYDNSYMNLETNDKRNQISHQIDLVKESSLFKLILAALLIVVIAVVLVIYYRRKK